MDVRSVQLLHDFVSCGYLYLQALELKMVFETNQI